MYLNNNVLIIPHSMTGYVNALIFFPPEGGDGEM